MVRGTTCALRTAGPLARRGLQGQGSWPRAQRASWTDSSKLFERRERSERSEFFDGPRDRASQGSRSAAEAASVARRSLPAHAFATNEPSQSGHRKTAKGRKQSCATRTKFKLTSSPDAALQRALAFHASRVAQRAMEN